MTVQIVTIAACMFMLAFSMGMGLLFGPMTGAASAFGCMIILFAWGLVAINRGEERHDG